MPKLTAWPNKLGYDYGDWEIYEVSQGKWIAREIPEWFGSPTNVGAGPTWDAALHSATYTDEYNTYLETHHAYIRHKH